MTTSHQSRYQVPGGSRRERVLAHMLGASLDRQLAEGRAAESSPLVAARARYLVSAAGRREIIRSWNNALRQARQPAFMPRAPLCRDRVITAEDDVRYLLALLAGPRPVAARGAALAVVLLTDGSGPVHNDRSPVRLGPAVREAIRQLDPLAAGTAMPPAPGPGTPLRSPKAS